jgi:ribose 5-phosphate isomerase B
VRISVGSDHAGFELKEHVAEWLRSEGHDVINVGTDSEESTHYPLFAEPAARLVADGEVQRSVLVCGSGVGVNIVANKVDGVRSVNAHDADEASMARKHNDVNVLTLSGRRLAPEQADAIVATFLTTEFEGGRHEQRVALIEDVEKR